MKVRLIAVGRVREPYVAAACEDFLRRLRRTLPIDVVEVAAAPGDDPARAMSDEGARVLARVDASETLWLLERTGEEVASPELAVRLRSMTNSGASRLSIVVGGTFGASDALLARANWCWSLSRLTFLHEWARALVLEQLYRATKIDRNEPYHH